MGDRYIRKLEDNPENSGTLEQGFERGRWLKRLGLWELVAAMVLWSEDHGLPWASSWYAHLDEPAWLRRAFVNTFVRLTNAEKELVRPYYDEWLRLEAHADIEACVRPAFNAECFLLDRDGRRVTWRGQAQTVLVGLRGQDRQEALLQLNTKAYEFWRWWPPRRQCSRMEADGLLA
ncbi:MAG: hypothetical protein IH624_02645 [Phycisphaerae bacterium]|nr:hypothetical protein [Phycisphaerae bacterium]